MEYLHQFGDELVRSLPNAASYLCKLAARLARLSWTESVSYQLSVEWLFNTYKKSGRSRQVESILNRYVLELLTEIQSKEPDSLSYHKTHGLFKF